MRVIAVALDSYGAGVILIVASTALSVLGLLVVRRCVDARTMSACHEVGSSLLSVVGTLYAVILGLIVVDAMSRFQEAHQDTGGESNALSDIVILSKRLPPEKRAEIRSLAAQYAEVVTREEWPLMSEGRFSLKAREKVLRLIDAITDFEPVTESQKTIYAACIEAGTDLWNYRRLRTNTATTGIPALEWVVLILGGMITIAFTYFFVLDRLRVQVVMTALVALIISLNIYLVSMFGYPYSGELKVDPGLFDVAHQMASEVERTTR